MTIQPKSCIGLEYVVVTHYLAEQYFFIREYILNTEVKASWSIAWKHAYKLAAQW